MRKFLLPSIVLATTALGVLSPASFAETLRVGESSPASSAIMPVAVGVEMGIFTKHGLDVKLTDFAGGSRLFQGMAANSIDIGISAGPEMVLIAKGAPILAVCNMAPSVPFLGISVPANSPIRSVDDLKGKLIGVASELSLSKWLAIELARARGWGINGVTPVAIGNLPAAILAAYRARNIDADIATTALAFFMEANNLGHLLIPVSDYEGNIGAGMIFATTDLIATNPNAIRRFIAGWLDTIATMRMNKDETVRIESGITGFPPAVMSKEYDLTIDMFSKDCKFDSESMANLQRSFTDMKLLPSPPDMSKLQTDAFIPKH